MTVDEEFESRKRTAVSTFGNVIRMSSIAADVEHQQLMVALTQLLDGVPPGGALDLGPLQAYLLDKGHPKSGVEEALVFFHSREEKIGIPFKVPDNISSVSDARRDLILEKFRNASGGQTYAGTGASKPSPPPGQSDAAAERERLRTQFDRRPPDPAAKKKRLFVVLGVVALAGAANLVYIVANQKPPPEPIPVASDPAGLKCEKIVRVTEEAAICEMTLKQFKAYSDTEFRTRAKVSRSNVKAMGMKHFYVRTIEDGLIHVY